MAEQPLRVTRALLSVSDKSGLIEFARALGNLGIELISTGGTSRALADAGLTVRDVSDLTGFPEMMDGRVKTLHPKVHGALLAVRGNEAHELAMATHGIAPIDLLVVTLYLIKATIAKRAAFDEYIENIDIGGPAMIRAAAKNHAAVAVVVEPDDYATVLAEIDQHGGTTLALRKRLAAKAYARTAAYDAAIANWFARELGEEAPAFRAFGGRLIEALRYGENPHQTAAFYRAPETRFGVASARQVQGKQLSYNNINDTDAAYECVAEFTQTPACAIIKHANPCGVAEAASLIDAYRKALACDPVSAFGGGLLVQSRDNAGVDEMQLRTVTKRVPSARELADLRFAFRVAKHVKSNTIVYAKDGATVGIGAGQMSRVDSARIAARKAEDAARASDAREPATRGSVVASDAFFPFADGLLAAIEAGATAVIQPGGSMRDDEVIKAADEHGVAMVFTGVRHFRH